MRSSPKTQVIVVHAYSLNKYCFDQAHLLLKHESCRYVQLDTPDRHLAVQALTNDSPGHSTDQDRKTNAFHTPTPFGLHFGVVVNAAVWLVCLVFLWFVLFFLP